MDQLPTDLQEALRKTNTERPRIMAAKTYDVGDDGQNGPARGGSEGYCISEGCYQQTEIGKIRPSTADGIAAGVEKNGTREQAGKSRDGKQAPRVTE